MFICLRTFFLLTAEKTNKIWINSFDKKITEIKNLHNISISKILILMKIHMKMIYQNF